MTEYEKNNLYCFSSQQELSNSIWLDYIEYFIYGTTHSRLVEAHTLTFSEYHVDRLWKRFLRVIIWKAFYYCTVFFSGISSQQSKVFLTEKFSVSRDPFGHNFHLKTPYQQKKGQLWALISREILKLWKRKKDFWNPRSIIFSDITVGFFIATAESGLIFNLKKTVFFHFFIFFAILCQQ